MAHNVRRYGDGDRDCRAGVRDGHLLRVAVPYGCAMTGGGTDCHSHFMASQ